MLMCVKILFYAALCSVLTDKPLVDAGTFEDTKKLYDYLEKKLDTRIKPVLNQSDVLYITVLPTLVSIQDLDEKSQLLSTTLVLQIQWTSETLQWLPSLFGGTNAVYFSPNHVWLPDLSYQNSVGNAYELRQQESMKVWIAANGDTIWITGSNLDTTCRVDITNYPFDTQTCIIIINRLYSLDCDIMLKLKSKKLDLTVYEENDEWILKESNVRHKKIIEQMHGIEVELILQRRSLFYLLNIISPVILLSVMNVFSFLLPITSGERMSYCISLFLTFIVLLNTISDSMPKVSKNVSYLQLYINIQLILGMVITTISILLVRMSQTENVPKWIITLNYTKKKTVKPFQNLNGENAEIEDNHLDKNELTIKGNSSPVHSKVRDSTDAVRFIDKMCFWFFLVVFVTSTLVLFLLMTI